MKPYNLRIDYHHERLNAKQVSLLFISVLIALLLSVISLPSICSDVMPLWAVLVVCYWVMVWGYCVNLSFAWFVGFFLDVLQGGMLGEHALALVVVAFVMYQFRRRIRMFLWLKQMLTIFMLTFLYQVIVYAVHGFAKQGLPSLWFWLAPCVSALVWPGVNTLLNRLRA